MRLWSFSQSQSVFPKTLQSVLNYFLINYEELEIVSCGKRFGLERLPSGPPPAFGVSVARQVKKHSTLSQRRIFVQNRFISKSGSLHNWDMYTYHKHFFNQYSRA